MARPAPSLWGGAGCPQVVPRPLHTVVRRAAVIHKGHAARGHSARADRLDELGDLVVDLPALLHERADLFHRVDHRCVVPAAVLPSDGGIAQVGELPADVHADLAGGDEGAAAALALELLDWE